MFDIAAYMNDAGIKQITRKIAYIKRHAGDIDDVMIYLRWICDERLTYEQIVARDNDTN